MASTLPLTVFVLLATLTTNTLAQKAAPGPAAAPVNLTAILEKGGQYTTFIHLLNTTQVASQIANQINSSTEGMTVFAPTDNAFQNLKPGALNSLSAQEQVQLILYHVLPKFYSRDAFETVSNPVRNQASGNDGKPFELTIISSGANQVNVSTGVVETQVNNALSEAFPLAVYQVDKVLLPNELFGTKAKAPATAPVSASPAKGKGKASSKADGPAADEEKNAGFGVRSMGLGAVFGVALATMGFLF